jgi:hypothetical protein
MVKIGAAISGSMTIAMIILTVFRSLDGENYSMEGSVVYIVCASGLYNHCRGVRVED